MVIFARESESNLHIRWFVVLNAALSGLLGDCFSVRGPNFGFGEPCIPTGGEPGRRYANRRYNVHTRSLSR
jgi:hypothetical protein